MIKIAILGGGFGGVRCALDLEKLFKNREDINIYLIDKNSYHLFSPELYEVASAYGLKRDEFAVRLRKTICVPYTDIFGDKNINFVQANVTSVDLENQKIVTGGGGLLDFNYLVFALGSQSSDFGVPGVNDYAFQFKNIEDGLMINKKLEELIEEAKENKRPLPVKILICGAGFTGVELASELSCCAKKLTRKFQANIYPTLITIFEAATKILPMISEKERRIILKRLTSLGIIVMENSIIEAINQDSIKLKNGQVVKGDIMIWTAGIEPNRLLKFIKDLPLNQKGKILVKPDLMVKDSENVFALGDNCEFIDPVTQKGIPAMAYIAVNQAKVVAKNIYTLVNHKKTLYYKPDYKIWLVPVGGKYGIAHLWGGVTFTGFLGWVARELVNFKYLISILSFKKATRLFYQAITIFSKND